MDLWARVYSCSFSLLYVIFINKWNSVNYHLEMQVIIEMISIHLWSKNPRFNINYAAICHRSKYDRRRLYGLGNTGMHISLRLNTLIFWSVSLYRLSRNGFATSGITKLINISLKSMMTDKKPNEWWHVYIMWCCVSIENSHVGFIVWNQHTNTQHNIKQFYKSSDMETQYVSRDIQQFIQFIGFVR